MIRSHAAGGHELAGADEIERELSRLWKEAASEHGPMVRARVMTLIAVAAESRESRIAELLAGLAARHPARTLILLLGPEEAPTEFDAAATLLCNTTARVVCAEQIRLHARGEARARLGGAARALLTPDLPTMLWWSEPERRDEALLDTLVPLADAILIDSARLDRVDRLPTLVDRIGTERLCDLNWQRLAPWRERVAQFFDPPECREWLERVEQVTIEDQGSMVAGWLLAAWLAHQLDWRPRSRRGDVLYLEAPDGREIRLRLERIREEPDDGPLGITLEGGGALFKLTRVNGALERISVLPDEQPLVLRAALPAPRTAALLSRELEQPTPAPLYAPSVSRLANLLE